VTRKQLKTLDYAAVLAASILTAMVVSCVAHAETCWTSSVSVEESSRATQALEQLGLREFVMPNR
jgi:hypothetical protein